MEPTREMLSPHAVFLSSWKLTETCTQSSLPFWRAITLVLSLLGRTADAAAEAASATTLANEKEENIIRNKNEKKECVSVQ
jgi:hypothetical protein